MAPGILNTMVPLFVTVSHINGIKSIFGPPGYNLTDFSGSKGDNVCFMTIDARWVV